MKYIRTKDRRIFDLTDKDYIVNGNDLVLHEQYETVGGPEIKPGQMFSPSIAIIQKHNDYIFVGEIDKQADTIEELCDRFVVVEHGLDDPFSVDSETAKTFISKAKVYGAIWTDKGLIYVAKMNDKGELELL